MSLKAEFTKREEESLVAMLRHYPQIFNPGNPGYKDGRLKDDSWQEVSARVGRTVEECKWRWKNVKDTYVKRKRKGTLEGPGTTYWHLAKSLQFLDQVEFKQRNVGPPKAAARQAKDRDVEFVDIEQVPETSLSKWHSLDLTDKAQKRKRSRHKRIKLPPVTNVSLDSIEPAETNSQSSDVVEDETKTSQFSIAQIPQFPIMQLPHVDFTDAAGTAEDHVEVFFRSVALSVKSFPKNLINEAKLRTLQMLVEMESKIIANNHGFIITPNFAGLAYATIDACNNTSTSS